MTRQLEHSADPTSAEIPMSGALINVIAVERTDVLEFDGWYSTEHFPERLAVNGFRTARRFVEHPDRGRDLVEYFSIYETDSIEVLTSSDYLAALDSPTPRTTQAVALFRENERTVGRMRGRGGPGRTGDIVLGRITCAADEAVAVTERVTAIARDAVDDGVAEGFSIYESDPVAAAAKDATAEGQAVGDRSEATTDETVALLLVVERHGSLAPQPVDRLTAAVDGLGSPVRWSTYRLVSDQHAAPNTST